MPGLAEPGSGRSRTVVLHSSWTGIVLSSIGAVAALTAAVLLTVAHGLDLWTLGGFVVASGFGAIVLFDMPIACHFGHDGVYRRAVLRTHHLPYASIDRLSRVRAGVLRTRRDVTGGGLVAKSGWRSYTLVDRMESALEFDVVVSVMGEWAEVLGLGEHQRPPEGRTPTWMYRRRLWRPDSAS